MKIALLNLPVDNNYGGNLQRYALMKVLQDMGHDVTHIFLKVHYSLPWYKYPYSYTKRVIKKYVSRKTVSIREEYYKNLEYESSLSSILPFYDKYINHTNPCYNINDVIKETKGKFDAYVVGSDQVWRKDMTSQLGYDHYFLKFVSKDNVKRIAYAASLGTEDITLNSKEESRIRELYTMFDAISVRESSAIDAFRKYDWADPLPTLCLDPTLLLDKEDYYTLIQKNRTENLTMNKIFAYVLDDNEKTKELIESNRTKLNKEVMKMGLKDSSTISIPQWLNNIRLADMVVTDSYHCVVFSILFNKPFIFVGNKRRGNARIVSLFDILHMNSYNKEIDYDIIDNVLAEWRNKSLCFLSKIS